MFPLLKLMVRRLRFTIPPQDEAPLLKPLQVTTDPPDDVSLLAKKKKWRTRGRCCDLKRVDEEGWIPQGSLRRHREKDKELKLDTVPFRKHVIEVDSLS